MSTAPPRVSVGMPVYNGADALAEALDSLLEQTFTDFEVLISDNASTDETEAVCRDYAARDPRIRYERNAKNLGAAGNFNRVLERAGGEFFKWFAHDDVLAPEYLEQCVRAFDEADEAVVLVHPGRRMRSPEGATLERDPYLVTGSPHDERDCDDISFPRLLRVCGSRCPIFVFGLMRTRVARQTRGMGAYIAADLVFVAEMRLRGLFRQVTADLFFQRLHAPTQEVMARTRRGGDAAWFDTRKPRRWIFPESKLLWEMIRAIRYAPLPALDKGRCLAALGGHVATRAHRWMVLSGRRMRSWCWRRWSGVSCWMVSAERVTTLPLRMWMMATGLRRWKLATAIKALARPWGRANPALLEFAGARLGKRSDARAVRIVAGWLLGPFTLKQEIAAKVLAERSAELGSGVAELLQHQGMSAERFVTRIREHVDDATGSAWARVLDERMPHSGAGKSQRSPTVSRVAG